MKFTKTELMNFFTTKDSLEDIAKRILDAFDVYHEGDVNIFLYNLESKVGIEYIGWGGAKNFVDFPMTWFLNSDDLDNLIKEYKKQNGLNH